MRKSALAAMLGLSLVASSPTLAGTVYETGFESPVFLGLPLVGPTLAGQDNWTSSPMTSPSAAIITTDQPFGGRQAVRVRGADLVPHANVNFVSNGYYAAVGSYRRRVDFDVAGAGFPIVRIQAFVRVDSRQIPQGRNFFSASVAARAVSTKLGQGTTGIGELAISSEGNVYGYGGNDSVPGCPSPPNTPPNPSCMASFLTSTPITLGAYHKLAVNADFFKREFSFCVDPAP